MAPQPISRQLLLHAAGLGAVSRATAARQYHPGLLRQLTGRPSTTLHDAVAAALAATG
jgi:hypothetical protein